MYGLNRRRSFLRLPSCEECGEMMRVVLDGPEDIEDFSIEALSGHECDSCALFYVHKDGTFSAYFKTVYDADDEDVTFAIGKIKSEDRHLFADLDGEMRFCCYSILNEIADGVYEVAV